MARCFTLKIWGPKSKWQTTIDPADQHRHLQNCSPASSMSTFYGSSLSVEIQSIKGESMGIHSTSKISRYVVCLPKTCSLKYSLVSQDRTQRKPLVPRYMTEVSTASLIKKPLPAPFAREQSSCSQFCARKVREGQSGDSLKIQGISRSPQHDGSLHPPSFVAELDALKR